MLMWLVSPYLASFFAAPATWIAALVEWVVFLITTLQAVTQAVPCFCDAPRFSFSLWMDGTGFSVCRDQTLMVGINMAVRSSSARSVIL